MEVSFTDKEESNKRREREFLALSPGERFLQFLHISRFYLKNFPSSVEQKDKGNFIVKKK